MASAERDDHPVRGHVPEWTAALGATLALAAGMTLDVADRSWRRFFVSHDFFTSATAGVLVLAVTVLVIDRIGDLRRLSDRSLVIAAQAAMISGQATRATRTLTDALAGAGERDAAADELRTFMTLLLISAPVLMEAPAPRAFLERSQGLAVELARTLAVTRDGTHPAEVDARLDAARERVRDAAEPLLSALSPDQRAALGAALAPDGAGAPSEPRTAA